jgi:Na+-transporting NADH:ubiquinone oxidoreductase subunit NqrD
VDVDRSPLGKQPEVYVVVPLKHSATEGDISAHFSFVLTLYQFSSFIPYSSRFLTPSLLIIILLLLPRLLNIIFLPLSNILPVTVAERSKACTVFARSEAGIVNSNPTQGTDI